RRICSERLFADGQRFTEELTRLRITPALDLCIAEVVQPLRDVCVTGRKVLPAERDRVRQQSRRGIVVREPAMRAAHADQQACRHERLRLAQLVYLFPALSKQLSRGHVAV